MTCKQVVALIDTLPLSGWPVDQREAAKRHADNCVACRSALAVANAVDSELTRLPEVAVPPELAASIAARLARLDEEPAAGSSVESRASTKTTRSESLAWAAALGGFVVGLVAQLYGLLSGESPLDLTSSRIGGSNGLIEMPDAGVTSFLVGLGLLLYLVGFLAPLRDIDTAETR